MNQNKVVEPSTLPDVSVAPDVSDVSAEPTPSSKRPVFSPSMAWDTVGLLLFAASMLFISYFILFPMRGFFDSDYADTLTWAKASVDAKALFSGEFTYACLLPFGGQLLMMPFVALFGYSYTAHACGMIVFYFLFALALFAFFRAVGASRFWAGLSLFCVTGALCSSDKLREVYFGHILYYSLGGLFLLVGLTLALTLHKDKEDKIQWRFIAFCVWCVLCSTDGLTSLTLFVLPLCAALVFERLCDKEVKFLSAENFNLSRPVLYAICASVAGLALGAFLRRGFEAPYQEAFSTFATEYDWQPNLDLFLGSFLSLFTGPVEMYEPFTSFTGVFAALRIVFGLFVLAAPILSLFFWKKLERGEKLLLVAHFTVCATMLFAFVFGLLSNGAWRLSPMLFTAILSTICVARRLSVLPFLKRFGLLVVAFCVLISGLGFYSVFRLERNYMPEGSAADLAEYLETRGCTYGYSTFWTANAITVLSDDSVKCRSIMDPMETGGILFPYSYQSEDSWFEGQGSGEKYFLLLTNSEYARVCEAQVIPESYPVEWHGSYAIIYLPADLFPAS